MLQVHNVTLLCELIEFLGQEHKQVDLRLGVAGLVKMKGSLMPSLCDLVCEVCLCVCLYVCECQVYTRAHTHSLSVSLSMTQKQQQHTHTHTHTRTMPSETGPPTPSKCIY